MGVMHDLIVPGSGTVAEVLSTIQQLCGEMKECQDPCTRLYQRLKSVLDSLVSLEKNKTRLPPPEALGKYVAVNSTTLSYLEHYRGKKLVFRLMKRQAMMDELRAIHEETDKVVLALGLTTTDKWKQQFEADQRTHRERLAASVDNAQEVLAELQDARSQQETMLTLKYEVELRPEQHDEDMAKLLRTMMATVIRTSTTSVPKLPPWFLPPYEVRFKPNPFARGSFATVHRGVRRPNANVVVKCFLVDGVDVDERTRQNIEMEMNLWHQFDHPNVIKLLGASHISTPPFIVCEDATNGDLSSFLARSDVNKQQLWRLLYQAALGLEYIHTKSVVHGDLKLNNVLVGADGQAKLSDFGLSAVRTSAILSETTGETPYTAGALRWRAPECLRRAPTFASDVYSFAMCIIEAVIGEPPFAFLDDDSVHEKLRKGEIPDKPEKMSAVVWELVVAMTNVDPAKRASLSQVLKALKELADGAPSSSPQSTAKADENKATPAENTIATRENHEPLLDADIIVDILDNVAGMDDKGKEQSLLHLVRMCVKDEERPVMYAANATQILTNLVKSSRTYYTKLYALQCLKWAVVVDAKLSQSELDSLRDCVSDVPAKELASLASALTNGTDQEKEEAALRCACIAARGNGGLWQGMTWLQPIVSFWQSLSEAQKLWIGTVQPLVSLLQSGNDSQKLWAAEAIGSLATENEAIRAEIVRADAITPLVELLSAGTDGQRHRASFALKNLALQAGVCQSIAQKGVIAPLLRLARLGTAQQKQTTSALLGSLVLPSYPNKADVEHERSITPLVALIVIGSDEQKETAVAVLSDLAKDDATQSEISRTGGVAPLVGLLRTGTNAQKAHAASVIMNLACNGTTSAEISREGGVAPLVLLAWKGNEQQKTSAAGALLKLSFDVEIGAEVVRCKGVSPLVELARTGTDQQNVYAAGALRNLAISDEVCAEISREGGVEALIRLLKSGTDRQKVGAIGALLNLYSSAAARSDIASRGGVKALLELLRTGTDEQQRLIACGLSHLAKYEDGRAEIAREGGIARLVDLLRAGSEQQKGYAADTIGDLAMSNDKIRAELKRGRSVPLLKKMSRSGSEELKESAARALQQLNGGSCIIM